MLGNVQVLGVVAAGRLGSAILIVDGKPARSFAVGDSIGPGQRVRTVRPDKVVIDDNGRMAEVPAPAPTSTAVLTCRPPARRPYPRRSRHRWLRARRSPCECPAPTLGRASCQAKAFRRPSL